MRKIRMASPGSKDDAHATLERHIRRAWEAEDFDAAATLAIKGLAQEILSFLSWRLGSVNSGQDAFSMFAEDLWIGLSRFRWRCSFRSWAYVLARNAAHRYATSPHNRVSRNLTLSSGLLSVTADRSPSAIRTYRRTEVKDRFRDLRERLDSDEQMLLVLRVDRGMRWHEIAVAMGGDTQLEGDALARESARLRKNFERVKAKLRRVAREAGLRGFGS